MAVKLRGALLGAGNIALRGHAPRWIGDDRLRDEVEIVAVADLSSANRAAAAALVPGARTYLCAEDLLAGERLDFCDICTPPSSHRALVETAAERGIAILCEKPIAHTLEDALGIERAVRRSGVVFQPCHQYHFSPQWLAVKQLLPRIGRVYLADYRVHRLAANQGNPHWDPGWRTDPGLSGGGILVDHGAHIFYQLRSVLGEPRTVQAIVRTLLHRGYEVEDTAFVTLDFGDLVAQVSLTWAARERGISFRFVGEQGEIVADEEHIRISAAKTEELNFPGSMSAGSSHSEWYSPLLREFADRIRRGDRGTGPLDEALYVTRVISTAYASCREGRALPLADPDGRAVDGRPMLDGDPRGAQAEAVTSLAAKEPVAAGRRSGWERILRGVAFAFLLVAMIWTFRDVQWRATTRAIAAAAPLWIALAVGVNLVALVFQATRWRAVLRPLSRMVTLTHSFKAMMVGYTVSMVVPARAGELARAHFLGRRTGLSRATVLGSIVLDHLVSASGLLVGLAVLPFFISVPGWMRSGGLIALALFVVAVTVIAALRPIERRHTGAAEPLPAHRFTQMLAKLQHGLTGARQPRALAVSFAASIASWALEIGVVSFALRSVGLTLPIPAAFLILAAVNLALAFPVAPPGNFGTVELGATLALLEFGVPKDQALAFAVCYHLLQIVPIAVMGLVLASREGFGKTFRKAAA